MNANSLKPEPKYPFFPSASKNGQTIKSRHRGKHVKANPRVVSAVKAFIRTNTIQQWSIADETGISPSTISQWLSMKYNGDNMKMNRIMLAQ